MKGHLLQKRFLLHKNKAKTFLSHSGANTEKIWAQWFLAKPKKIAAGGTVVGQAWQGMVSDRMRVPQHTPKIILGVLLSRALQLKIAHLVLIFNLVLILHAPPPQKKYFIITHFETTFLLLSKLVWSLAPWKR